jgi:hypothetical protein
MISTALKYEAIRSLAFQRKRPSIRVVLALSFFNLLSLDCTVLSGGALGARYIRGGAERADARRRTTDTRLDLILRHHHLRMLAAMSRSRIRASIANNDDLGHLACTPRVLGPLVPSGGPINSWSNTTNARRG